MVDYKEVERIKRERFGSTMQKVLLLLRAGATLMLSVSPNYIKIMNSTAKEWRKINYRTLKDAIRRLYQSKLVSFKENEDGTVSLGLTENGEKKILRYNLDNIKIKKPAKWDSVWRMVIFDIPESNKKGRDALAAKLKELGFYPLQKSVFIYPYECKDEIDFVVELFELSPYVRFMRLKDIDIDIDLRHRFELL